MSLGLALGAVGGYFFGPLGLLFGTAIGNLLMQQKQEGPRLTDLHTSTSEYGLCIPRIWGRYRVPMIIVWADDLVEHSHHEGGKGGPRLAQGPTVTIRGRPKRLGIRRDNSRSMKGAGPEVTTYTYTVSFYGHLCEAPPEGMNSFKKIWIDKQLEVDIDQGDSPDLPYTFFNGSSSQQPFSAAEAVLGVGLVPAYRSKCGMGWDTLDVGKWGNRIPNVEVEVVEAGGYIPWRVSTFDPFHGAPNNSVQWGGRGGARLEDGVLTVFHMTGGGTPTIWDEWTTDIYGEPIGSPFNIVHVNPILAEATTGLPAVPYGPCLNGPIYGVYAAVGGAVEAWYVHGSQTSTIGNFTAGDNETVVNSSLIKGDFLYAIGNGSLMKFAVTDDVPGGQTAIVDLPEHDVTHPSLYKLGDSNDRFVYVAYDTGFSSAYYKFDPDDLSLLETWNAGDTPHAFGGAAPFMIYDGQLVFNGVDAESGTLYSLYVYSISGPTFTLVGKADQTQGGFSYLGAGLVIGGDGVLSLRPPPDTTTLGRIVAAISDLVGQTSYDVDTLVDIVDGYCISSQGSGVAAISPLQNAWPFDAVESASGATPVFKFVRRGQAAVIDLPTDDLAAHARGAEKPAILAITRKLESELPRTVYTKYANIDADYLDGSQYERRLVGNATSDITLELPIAMSDAYGKTVAGIYLYGAWLARTSFKFFTSVKYAWLEPTDVITIGIYTMRITKKIEHTTGVFEWEALQDDSKLWVRSFSGVTGAGNTTPVISSKVASDLVMLDLPLIDDADAPSGAYADMAPISPVSSGWSGQLYKSIDGGTTYALVDTTATQAVMGTCSNAIAPFDEGFLFDESNVIHVVLGPAGGTLSSVSRDEALAGQFRVLAGQEVIYARDAVLTAPGEYDISGLLRGQRGTEWAMTTHHIDERFHLLPPVMNPALPYAELGFPAKFKGVTKGKTVASATAVDFTNRGMALKCYAPCLVGGGPDTSDNVVVNWTRRTRIGGDWNGGADAPLAETTEKYELEFWDATRTICARTIECLTPTGLYLEADQITDFGAKQSGYYVSVGMVGSYGIGTRALAFIPGAGVVINDPIVSVIPYDGVPSLPPPPPPGGPTPPVNYDFGTATGGEIHPALTVGNVYVYKFTTSGTPNLTVYSAEYAGGQAFRHMYLSTNGLPSGKVHLTDWSYDDAYGTTVSLHSGALTPSTVYYAVIDFKWPDGSWMETPGTIAHSLVTLVVYS